MSGKGDADRGDKAKRGRSKIYCQVCGKTKWCCECKKKTEKKEK